jgi:hypothetical protein
MKKMTYKRMGRKRRQPEKIRKGKGKGKSMEGRKWPTGEGENPHGVVRMDGGGKGRK